MFLKPFFYRRLGEKICFFNGFLKKCLYLVPFVWDIASGRRVTDKFNICSLLLEKSSDAIKLSESIRIGPPKLTRFERARIVGARALQLSMGAPILVILPDSVIDPIDISIVELEGKVLPMTVRRILPEGTYQDIPLVDLLT